MNVFLKVFIQSIENRIYVFTIIFIPILLFSIFATDGENLPVTFKFTRLGKTVYHTFDTVEELKKYYIDINKHITTCLESGWKRKDSINVDDYII